MVHAMFAMIAAGLSDVGRVRAHNEDCFHLNPDLGLALVCDGMGGHAGGHIASRLASDVIEATIAESALLIAGGPPSRGPRDARELVRLAVERANRRIHDLNRDRGMADGRGMGTTVVGIWRVPGGNRLVVFHVGDSRLYRLRDGVLAPLTRDHSLYQIWQDNGRKGPAPNRNIIVRALGPGDQVEPEVSVASLQSGDQLLLCSDGLNGMVPDVALAQALDTERPPDQICARLIDLANEAGGHDNITAVVARFINPA